MREDSFKTWAPWILLGVGGYVLYRFFSVAKESAEKGIEYIETAADATLARPIAYVISKLILPGRQHVAGGAVLPDGGYVSFDAIISATGQGVDDQNRFQWGGLTYQLVPPRRSDGNYNAKRA